MRRGVLNGVAVCLTMLALSVMTACRSGPVGSGSTNDEGAAIGAYGALLPNAEELWSARVPVDETAGRLESLHLLRTRDAAGSRQATIYLISSRHHVVALDEAGVPKWVFTRLKLPPEFPPVEGPTAVALVTRDTLWLVDRQTGSLLTRKTLSFTPSAPPALSRSAVYLPSLSDNRIYAVSIADGAEGWRVRLSGPISSAPAVGGSVGRPTLHVATEGGSVMAFDALDASAPAPDRPLWKKKLADGVIADLSVSNDASLVFVPSEDFSLHAYRVATGEKAWAYPAGRALQTPATEVNGVVFQKNGAKLVALDAASGEVKWAVEGADRPICKWGDSYLVAGPGRKVRRVNARDGAVLAAEEVPEDFLACDPVGGRFIMADRNWKLTVLRYRPY